MVVRSPVPLSLPLIALCLAVAVQCSSRRDASRPVGLDTESRDGADGTASEPEQTSASTGGPERGGTAGTPRVASVEGLDVRYVAQGGYPPVWTSLHVAPDGAAELEMTSSWSRPSGSADTLGSFAAALEPARREALARLVEDGDLLDHDPGEPPTSPDSTTRTLILARGDREARITMARAVEQEPEELAAVERLLGEIIGDLALHPVRAVRASWELAPDGEGVRPVLTIAPAGTDPIRILFFDPEDAGFRLRAEAWFESEVRFPGGTSAWNPVGDRTASGPVLERLVADGVLPAGELDLAPGATYRFSLPSFTPPVVEGGVRAHGVLAFHRVGPGAARTLLTFDLPPLPVP